MIKRLSYKDTQSYKNLRLLSLKSDPVSYLSSLDKEEKLSDSVFAYRLGFNQKEILYGYWGYFSKNILVAYVEVADGYYIKKRHIIFFNELYVRPEYRRKGIASKLIKYLIKKIKKEKGIEKIYLRVNSKNKNAIAFYESLGFSKEAILKNAVKETDNSYQDEYFYSLLFK